MRRTSQPSEGRLERRRALSPQTKRTRHGRPVVGCQALHAVTRPGMAATALDGSRLRQNSFERPLTYSQEAEEEVVSVRYALLLLTWSFPGSMQVHRCKARDKDSGAAWNLLECDTPGRHTSGPDVCVLKARCSGLWEGSTTACSQHRCRKQGRSTARPLADQSGASPSKHSLIVRP